MEIKTLGTRYECFMCQAKFYDLNRPEPVCPKCRANQKEAPKPVRAAPARSKSSERARARQLEPPPETDPDDSEVELIGLDDEG